ncbi:hypothetical protein [Actinoplanes couchii]|uniref:Lipoprotein n=1 Tax=Actinoplanes couchii TaxID=403638 RepID=A0ABQ3XEF5_9ACTN|nr:hypothetical protein [Actinoplanes couchii]MDR6319755.1 hypothetical protein [Actinoplanes couchii]GID56889.1 hypothetical protein Aco03nite_052930 [Actinoplanes couchii]
MGWRGAAIVAVVVGLTAAGCTDPAEPPAAPAPSGSAAPSMTYEEAYRALPLDGTEQVPITWDPAGVPETAEILAARRSLAQVYWMKSLTDWAPAIRVSRLLSTDKHYDGVMAPFADTTTDTPQTGPVWVRTMGVAKTGADETTVTFCVDTGNWGRIKDDTQRAEIRATLESYVMHHVQTGDGERRWLTDGGINGDESREGTYGAECTEWAKH